MAKTSRSLTGDPAVKGAPTGYMLPITNVMVSVGAGFVIPLVGEVKFILLSQICTSQYRDFTYSIEVMFVIKLPKW
jgi:formyltetrahydrofolate synthetase